MSIPLRLEDVSIAQKWDKIDESCIFNTRLIFQSLESCEFLTLKIIFQNQSDGKEYQSIETIGKKIS